MTSLGDSRAHYWLAQRMARATGTNLVKASQSTELNQDAWAGMVAACRGCDWVEGCQRWLGQPRADGMSLAHVAPVGCVNRDKFLNLKTALAAGK